jgi:hypothetical protein
MPRPVRAPNPASHAPLTALLEEHHRLARSGTQDWVRSCCNYMAPHGSGGEVALLTRSARYLYI